MDIEAERLRQVLTEILLSDEFMKKFAEAFANTEVPEPRCATALEILEVTTEVGRQKELYGVE